MTDTHDLAPSMEHAVSALFDHDPASLCELLGIDTSGPVEIVPFDFSTADDDPGGLFHQIGDAHWVQIEYVDSPTAELVPRMLRCRGFFMGKHPGHTLSQYVVVGGDGRVSGHDGLAGEGFNVIYLRDREEGLADMLTILIVDRFGERDGVQATANRLAHWTNRATAIHAIQDASSLDELMTVEPPA